MGRGTGGLSSTVRIARCSGAYVHSAKETEKAWLGYAGSAICGALTKQQPNTGEVGNSEKDNLET